MFSLEYLARLKWLARVSISLGRFFQHLGDVGLRHFNPCSHSSQNMGILSMFNFLGGE